MKEKRDGKAAAITSNGFGGFGAAGPQAVSMAAAFGGTDA
jgi:hypothetical protein